ncbi:MAG: prepilin-type N-terminal cleavage/methylation domain-containing protein [Pseudomonadota bacterium]
MGVVLSSPKSLRARGFSLLELLIVLAIVAGTLSVAVPALMNSSSTDLKGTARTIASGLRNARERAIADNRSVALVLDLKALEIELSSRAGQTRQLSDSLGYKLFAADSEWLSDTRGGIRG